MIDSTSIPDNTSTSPKFQSIDLQSLSTTWEPMQGPSLGPSASSPYSSNRSMVQELTLPIHANLNIPPSPPNSPYPGLDQKISHFLSLKHRGIHFNTKLASNSALKNPSLLAKLIESAGFDEEGAQDQYASTLPRELWDPYGFPVDVYTKDLTKTQQDVEKRKSGERKGAQREFVTAKASKNG